MPTIHFIVYPKKWTEFTANKIEDKIRFHEKEDIDFLRVRDQTSVYYQSKVGDRIQSPVKAEDIIYLEDRVHSIVKTEVIFYRRAQDEDTGYCRAKIDNKIHTFVKSEDKKRLSRKRRHSLLPSQTRRQNSFPTQTEGHI